MDDKRGLVSWVYNNIKNKILNNELNFGHQINIKEHMEEFQVSYTVVREVLERLVRSGLITKKPRTGYYVFKPTKDDIREIMELRMMLELYAIECSKKNDIDISPFKDVKREIEEMLIKEEMFKKENYVKTEVVHHLIISQLDNSRIKNFYDEVRDITLLFQHLVKRSTIVGIDRALKYHLKIANSIISKNYDKTEKLISEHVDISINHLGELLEENT